MPRTLHNFVQICTMLLVFQMGLSMQEQVNATTPPLPFLPIPSYSQLEWQQKEMIMFLHFGVNTFTDREWGTGQESPSVFNPTGLNASQWADVAAQVGFSLMILTTKHHDGFCLWPSRYTDHSVIGSPWKNGTGDVVAEFVEAAKARGIDAGFYLSPWDMHDPRYGDEKLYNEYYLAQLHELLTRYGDIREIWFDGAKGSNAPDMKYHFNEWFSTVKELQSSINIFSDAGPGVRWVGNERASAGRTCWSTINASLISIGYDSNMTAYLESGDPKGTDWVAPECDVSIRTGWFWHSYESPKSLTKLLNMYYSSVGRNCVLLLNVPPNTTGLISDSDVQRLQEFKQAIQAIFSTNLAEQCSVQASSQRGNDFGPLNVLDFDHLWTYWAPSEDKQEYWIELGAISGKISFNVIRIQEAIGLGQRIEKHEVYVDGIRVVRGSTVGYKRLHRLEVGVVQASSVRIKIVRAKGLPLISSLGLHLDPFWIPKRKMVLQN